MKKLATLTAAAAVLAMAGTGVYAQSNEAPAKPIQQERLDKKIDWQAKRAEMQRYAEARIAGIPAGLKLTADQQKLWQPVEEALKVNMKSRSDLMTKMREARREAKERPDYMQRLEARAEMTQLAAQNSKNLLDAMKPFWASLDDGQKKLLPPLLQPHNGGMKRGKGHWGFHEGMMHHRGEGPYRGGPGRN